MFLAQLAPYRRLGIALCLLLANGSQSAQAQFKFSPGSDGGFGRSSAEVSLEAQFTPPAAGRPALLFVTAHIADGFHVYAMDQGVLPDGGGPMAASITLASNGAARLAGRWRPIQAPHVHVDNQIWTGLELREHTGLVTWYAPLELTSAADPASLTLQGKVAGQACNPQTCIPFEQSFTARLGTGVALPPGVDVSALTSEAFPSQAASADSQAIVRSAPPTAERGPLAKSFSTETPLTSSSPSSSEAVYDLSRVTFEKGQDKSLIYYLVIAFFGGVILNVMPCVLPVIGLKVMSFVHQAGKSRAHAWALNVWYSAGIVAVFLVLATLAVTLQLGWGGQFGSAQFNIALIAIVYAMALSMLGLWEIPIPGFVGSSSALEMADREGPSAAFLKGVLTTLLATPCTGPFMATALAWAVKQPTWTTYSVFGVLGLGMASPYLLVGAFPELIRFLPKPGAWMETFKKIMGLVLLATVVWLMTFLEAPLVVPTVAFMVGIAAVCWWVSQTPVTASFSQKLYGWTVAGLLTMLVAMGSYGWLYKRVMLPRFEKKIAEYAEQQIEAQRQRLVQDLSRAQSDEQLRQIAAQLAANTAGDDQPWQRFSLAKLGQLTLHEGRTVLVDFSADWCLTCKTLEKFVLKTRDVEKALAEANVVTMEADYTRKPEPVDRAIKALGGVGVPLIAIFPAADPYHPIVFSDGKYTKAALIDAIAQATGQSMLPEAVNSLDSSAASLTQALGREPRR